MTGSPVVSGRVVVGVDIGGTKVLAGRVSSDGSVAGRTTVSTPGLPVILREELVEAVARVVETVADGEPVDAVGVGAAAWFDKSRGRAVFAPHLPWRDEPVRERLEARLRVPVVVDNDANTMALAESRLGAARGAGDALFVTLGTGIGGALMLDGQVYRGAGGLAGEFGHVQVVEDGLPCECGDQGCWEQYASGRAIVRLARDVVARSSPSAGVLRELLAGDPAAVTGPLVAEAARAGDADSVEVLARVGRWLGTGLAGLAATFDPEVFVIGGGGAAAGDLLLDPARSVLAEKLPGRGHRSVPPVVPAELGEDAGFVGAGLLAWDELMT